MDHFLVMWLYYTEPWSVRYVFTATKLLDVGGEDEGVWFADRCSEFLFVSIGETLVSGFPFSTWPLFGITAQKRMIINIKFVQNKDYKYKIYIYSVIV